MIASPEQIQAAQTCLRKLSSLDPDGASKQNGVGFNQADTGWGHRLAKLQNWMDGHFTQARMMVWRYRNQLDPVLVDLVWQNHIKPANVELIGDLGGPEEAPPLPATEEESVEMADQYIDDVLKAKPETFLYSGVELTDEQLFAVQKVEDWLSDPSPHAQEFKLGGYAGTGKTTIIKYLLARLTHHQDREDEQDELNFLRGKHPMVCAFTGKACAVLRRKGVRANTIHSTMYRVSPSTKPGILEWTRVYRQDLPGNFFIVDEASMISTEIYNDMKSYGLKMLFVGDPGQLEPVGENPNLMRSANVVLQKIHRQALESPIIKLATDIRHGFPLPPLQDGAVTVRDKELNTTVLLAADQVICAKNKTRDNINRICRQAYSRTKPLEVGDKLIITKNNKDLGVFNGMIVWVDEIRKEDHRMWYCVCHGEDNDQLYIPIAKEPYSLTYDPKKARIPRDLVLTDYGYCITCHKSQGSEWDHVLVIDEWVPDHVWDMKRWRYTAFTRAAKKLTICRDFKK